MPQPIDPAQNATQWQQRRLDDPVLLKKLATLSGKPVAPLRNWELFELTLAAFHFNPDLEIAKTRWIASDAARAAAGVLPKPGVSGKLEHHSRASGVPAWSVGIGLEIPMVSGEKVIAKLDQATALSEAARLEVGATAWQIRTQVRSRFLQVLAAETRRALSLREMSLRGEIVDLLAARVAAGVAATGEATEARLQLRHTSAAFAAETHAVQVARGQLADAIGLPQEALEEVQPASNTLDRAVEIPKSPPPHDPILDRYDFRAELARYAASEAKLRLEIARQYPEFVLGPGLVFDQGDRIWSLGTNLLSGLFDRNIAGIAEAAAQRENARQRVLALQAQLLSQQAKSIAALHSVIGERKTARQLLKAAEAQTLATEKRVAAGHDDRLELARQRLDMLIAERIVLAADIAALSALGSLEDILQHPLDGSFPGIDVLPEGSS